MAQGKDKQPGQSAASDHRHYDELKTTPLS